MLVVGQRDAVSHEIGRNRQFAAAAVDQGRQHDLGRPAVIEQLVDRGARGTSGVQHVIHQHDGGVVDLEWNLGRLDLGVQSFFSVVVAVERDVDVAEPLLQVQLGGEALGEPGATRIDADQRDIFSLRKAGFDLFGERLIQRFRIEFRIRHIHRSIVAK